MTSVVSLKILQTFIAIKPMTIMERIQQILTWTHLRNLISSLWSVTKRMCPWPKCKSWTPGLDATKTCWAFHRIENIVKIQQLQDLITLHVLVGIRLRSYQMMCYLSMEEKVMRVLGTIRSRRRKWMQQVSEKTLLGTFMS